jgi:hypothetical protein
MRSVFLLLSVVSSAVPAAEADIVWHHQARIGKMAVMANPLDKGSRTAFYAARGFTADAIRPYAETCGLSFGMRNDSAATIAVNLTQWRAIGADGKVVGFILPATWDEHWRKVGVAQTARIAFRWAQFQSENVFAPGDWIMGMATLEAAPARPFRIVASYQDEKGSHEIVLDRLACARD